jgi:hypothetical protein
VVASSLYAVDLENVLFAISEMKTKEEETKKHDVRNGECSCLMNNIYFVIVNVFLPSSNLNSE